MMTSDQSLDSKAVCECSQSWRILQINCARVSESAGHDSKIGVRLRHLESCSSNESRHMIVLIQLHYYTNCTGLLLKRVYVVRR